MIDVAAIVVTHNHARELDGCLRSLLAHTGGVSLRVAVCDSGSTDDVAGVAARHPVLYVPGPNSGFAAASNRGLALRQLDGARYALFVNPDVRIVEGTLSALVDACDRHPGAGIAGVRLIDDHGRLVHNMGRSPTPAEYWRMARSGWGDWNWDSAAYADAATCAWIEGSFMLARRELVDRLGGFDERFFLYSEEVDLCTRARRAGWEVRYLPVMTAMHRVAERPFDAHRARLVVWSKLRYIDKWYGGARRASMRLALTLFYAHQTLHRRRAGVSSALESTQLRASLRFRRDSYGPATGTASGA